MENKDNIPQFVRDFAEYIREDAAESLQPDEWAEMRSKLDSIMEDAETNPYVDVYRVMRKLVLLVDV